MALQPKINFFPLIKNDLVIPYVQADEMGMLSEDTAVVLLDWYNDRTEGRCFDSIADIFWGCSWCDMLYLLG